MGISVSILSALLITYSSQSYGFLAPKERGGSEPQKQIVLVFDKNLERQHRHPLVFPCVLETGEITCDPETVVFSQPICKRTLQIERTANNQYVISCLLGLSKEVILGVTAGGTSQFRHDGQSSKAYLPVILTPAVKLELVFKPRKNGFGWIELGIQSKGKP